MIPKKGVGDSIRDGRNGLSNLAKRGVRGAGLAVAAGSLRLTLKSDSQKTDTQQLPQTEQTDPTQKNKTTEPNTENTEQTNKTTEQTDPNKEQTESKTEQTNNQEGNTTQTNKTTEQNTGNTEQTNITETAKTETNPFLDNFTGNITQDCTTLGSLLTGFNNTKHYSPRLSAMLAFDAKNKVEGIKYIVDGKIQSVTINAVKHTTMTASQVLGLMKQGTTTVSYNSLSGILTISTITPKK